MSDVERARPFSNHYAVSELGEVWSRKRGVWTKLRPTITSKGYARLTLILDGVKSSMRVNRIVAEAWHGPAPFAGAVARHLDDDKSNNVPTNIAWGTVSQNSHDAIRNGRADPASNGKKGAKKISGHLSSSCKLSWQVVRLLRDRVASGESVPAVARDLGIERSNAYLIILGKTWKEANVDPA